MKIGDVVRLDRQVFQVDQSITVYGDHKALVSESNIAGVFSINSIGLILDIDSLESGLCDWLKVLYDGGRTGWIYGDGVVAVNP